MVHSFRLRCRLSLESIMVSVDYEWKLRVCETCKVFWHSCKASIETIKLHIDDIYKIMNEGDILLAYNS